MLHSLKFDRLMALNDNGAVFYFDLPDEISSEGYTPEAIITNAMINAYEQGDITGFFSCFHVGSVFKKGKFEREETRSWTGTAYPKVRVKWNRNQNRKMIREKLSYINRRYPLISKIVDKYTKV